MTLLAPPVRPASLPLDLPEGSLLLRGVSWETYESLRDEVDAAGQRLFITYDNGTMHLMSPLIDHEVWKGLIGRLVETLALELRIPIRGAGSTTLKRRELGKGAEADECYYVQNVAAMKGKRRLDLTRDPPPDLAIEIEGTYSPIDKPSIYASLGVNEIWKCDGRRVKAFQLDRSVSPAVYREVPRSAAFPFLKPADLEPFLAQAYDLDDTSLLLEFQKWVRLTFASQGAKRKGKRR
jgi:Uma2 family endonuclease